MGYWLITSYLLAIIRGLSEPIILWSFNSPSEASFLHTHSGRLKEHPYKSDGANCPSGNFSFISLNASLRCFVSAIVHCFVAYFGSLSITVMSRYHSSSPHIENLDSRLRLITHFFLPAAPCILVMISSSIKVPPK